jgi:hypothetical protein
VAGFEVRVARAELLEPQSNHGGSMTRDKMTWNQLVDIFDYWDEPRSGVAYRADELVTFECLFDEEADDWSTTYQLVSFDEALLPMLEERGAIFERWANAFHSGRTTKGSHPALPDDRERYDMLDAIVQAQFKHEQSRGERVRGEFRLTGVGKSETGLSFKPHAFEVRWISEQSGL